MMGKKAMEAAQLLVDILDLQGQLTAEDFLAQREAALDAMFPSSELMPGLRTPLDLLIKANSIAADEIEASLP